MLRLHGVLVILLSIVFLGWGAAGAATPQRARGSCPAEPAEVRALCTDLHLTGAPISTADVFSRQVPRFFISGNTTQETTIEGEYDGKVREHVRWTLTFTRVS